MVSKKIGMFLTVSERFSHCITCSSKCMSNQQTYFADATPLTVIGNFPFAAGCFTGSASRAKSYFLTTSSDLLIVDHHAIIMIKKCIFGDNVFITSLAAL